MKKKTLSEVVKGEIMRPHASPTKNDEKEVARIEVPISIDLADKFEDEILPFVSEYDKYKPTQNTILFVLLGVNSHELTKVLLNLK
jgi:hypothetical protein